jgi:hypothetical protein
MGEEDLYGLIIELPVTETTLVFCGVILFVALTKFLFQVLKETAAIYEETELYYHFQVYLAPFLCAV